MKVCILGGGNVYALNLARHLHELDIEHFGIGRSGPKPAAFWQVEHPYAFAAMHLIRDFDVVLELLDKMQPDVIVNFAAQGERAASFGEAAAHFYRTNTLALVELAEALAKRDWLGRFIQISTSELYGSVERPAREDAPLRPSSPYAVSKAAFDLHLGVMHATRGFPAIIVRPSNCYCPGQQLHRIIPRAIRCALTGQRLSLHGGGAARKSWMHATDLSRAIVSLLEHGAPGELYNCGALVPVTVRRLAEHVAEACGVRLEALVEDAPAREGEDGCYWLDSHKLAATARWVPEIGFERGLEEMVRWFHAHPELLEGSDAYRLAA